MRRIVIATLLRRVAGSLLLPAAALPAQQTTYADRAAFAAALAPGATTIGFDGVLPPGTVSGELPTMVGGATFGSPTRSALTVFAYASPYYGLPSMPDLLVSSTGWGYAFDVAFGGGVTAFGIDYARSYETSAPLTFTFTLLNGATPVYSATRTNAAAFPAAEFFGVTSSVPFTSVAVSASGAFPLYDDVTFGAAAPPATSAPEPATLALLAPALLAVGAVRRRARPAA